MKAKLLLLSLFLSTHVMAQTCTIKMMTPDNTLTDSEYYIMFGEGWVASSHGILSFDTKEYAAYLDTYVLVSFSKPEILRKLYKDFPYSRNKTRLRDLCGKTFYLEYN